MKIRYTDNIEELAKGPKWQHDKVQNVIELFMQRPEKAMVITWEPTDGYKTAMSMSSTYYNAVKRSGYALRIRKNGNDIWIIKMVDAKES